MRVHGVGDHGVFSALGKPVYTGTVADRVRIGSLPLIPKHELKLINWSRPSRRITRTLGWYLVYPFTLVNMAGFMGPERSEDRAERRLWWFMRTVVVASSLMMTFAMAMWITVILETAWRLLGGVPHGLGSVFLCVFAPALLAGAVVNRMLRSRPLVDQGNRRVALLTLAVLLGFLAGRAIAGKGVLDSGEATTRDPMTVMVGATTLVAWSIASALCCVAWRAERSRKGHGRSGFRPVQDRTALAGAGILIAFAIAILHTAGSGLRLFLQTVLKYTPPVIERRVHGAADNPRMVTETAAYGHFDHVLPIDVIPVLFLIMARSSARSSGGSIGTASRCAAHMPRGARPQGAGAQPRAATGHTRIPRSRRARRDGRLARSVDRVGRRAHRGFEQRVGYRRTAHAPVHRAQDRGPAPTRRDRRSQARTHH